MSAQRACSSSVPSPLQWKYDVFLSFRGEDTRKSFTSHLYDKLKWLGIATFLDDAELEIGKEFSRELSSAIEQSCIAIVVISQNFASSTWCLGELLKILECMEKREAILPIFYDLEPSQVRKQTENFAKAFKDHEERFENDPNKVQNWRAALTKVAGLKGWTSKHSCRHEAKLFPSCRDEAELIKQVVKEVQNKVRPVHWESEKLIGMEPRLEQLRNCLRIESDDVRFIGICGMDGMGKTTIARMAYNSIHTGFEVSSFVDWVSGISEKRGLDNVQRRLFNSLMKTNVDVWGFSEEDRMRKFLGQKKVLLILDDVTDRIQLETLCGEKDWFGRGSRIIITTANDKLLTERGVERFKMTELDEDEARQLFSWNAFRRDFPDESKTSLSKCFLTYANGHPLALKSLGSFLRTRDLDEWTSALEMLQDGPSLDNDLSRQVMKVLKISYDGLSGEQKNIFLDIACFFKGKCRDQVVQILDSCGFHPVLGINVLIEKSLITISDNIVWMHDLFQAMGQAIVLGQSPEPGNRSRLWLSRDIYHVLVNNTGTAEVQGIVLDSTEMKESPCKPQAFSNMFNLRFLKIHAVCLPQGLNYFPNSLRFLDWRGYPLEYLPPDFQPDELVELYMCYSSIKRLWDGVKYLNKLKVINLSQSKNLTRTPDFEEVQLLEKLDLEGCESLLVIHPSLGALKRLIFLNLKDCRKLDSLPDEIAMECLEILVLSGCSSAKKIPGFVRPMEHLRDIALDGTAIKSIPPSIECLTSLASLDMRDCVNLSSLPHTIGNLKSLKRLNVSGCSKLAHLPESFGELESLEEIGISGTLVREWPSSSFRLKNLKSFTSHGPEGTSRQSSFMSFCLWLLGMKSHQPVFSLLPPPSKLPCLTQLDLSDRNLLEGALPLDIGCLSSLVSLNLSGNNFLSLPESISQLCTLENLNLSRCKMLQCLPVLSSNRNLEVIADGCTSLKVLHCPSNLDRLKTSCFNFINCTELADQEIALTMLKRYVKGIHRPGDRYEMVIRGSEIPSWFIPQRSSFLVDVELPQSSNKDKWIGYALCVVFNVLSSGWELSCVLEVNGKQEYPVPLLKTNVKPLLDHLWLFYVSHDLSFSTNWDNSHKNQLVFSFKSSNHTQVRKCGVHLVCEQDVQNLHNIIPQSSKAMDDDALHPHDKSAFVQSWSTKRSNQHKDGEGPSASGSFDEESHLKRFRST